MDVTITVAGPGGCISYEMEVIRQALIAAGVKVNVVDDHPLTGEDGTTPEQYMEDQRERMDPNGKWANIPHGRITREVKLVAKHYPWGG